MPADVFGNEFEGEEPEVEETSGEPTTGGSANADLNAAVLELQRGQASTNEAISKMASSLQSIFSNAATSAANEERQEPTNGNDLVTDLASRGEVALTERLNKHITERANEQLAPHLQGLTEAIHDSILTKAVADLDSEFGEGAFEKHIKEGLEQDLQNLRTVNYRAIADKRSVKALIDRHIGINYKALRVMETEKVAKDTAHKTKNTVSTLPGSRGPRISLREGEMDSDTKTFIDEIESVTGEKVDTKLFGALHNTGNTLSDYLAVTSPAKKAGARPN